MANNLNLPAIQTASLTDQQEAEEIVLPLRLTPASDRPNVTWREDTVDNEHLGRKSSKRCCIFHKARKFGESSSESESSDDSDSSSENEGDDDGNRNGAGKKKKIARKKKGKSIPAHQRFHA